MNKYLLYMFILLVASCNSDNPSSANSIHEYVDNQIYGSPLRIEVFHHEKPSIFIESDSLHRYNEGNTILYGSVYADLFDKEGIKKSEMYADTAIIYNKSDSVVATGDVLVESIKGYKLYTNKIILYNDIKLVKSYDNIMFTSNNADTLYGIGFWSDFDMENSQILKPIGRIIEKSE